MKGKGVGNGPYVSAGLFTGLRTFLRTDQISSISLFAVEEIFSVSPDDGFNSSM